MNGSDLLKILHGWRDFQEDHGLNGLEPVLLFGVYMLSSINSRRQARTEVAGAINDVAVDIRRHCVRNGVPLWPAIREHPCPSVAKPSSHLSSFAVR